MEGVGRGSPEGRDAEEALAVGARVGRYQIVRRLGAGGMGVVFAARDCELDREVALKILHNPGYEGAAARLAREGKALAKLAHPNVVTVYDIGRDGDEVFIAMELVEGESLRTWMAVPHSFREVLGVFIQAARGIAAAHRAGLVHRDFKPDNVLIDRAVHVRVTDFGLARAMGMADPAPTSPSAQSDTITRSGVVLGTPAYMAPEQYLGLPVDARADQWSFAVSLVEALSGEPPFGEPRIGTTVAPPEESAAPWAIPAGTILTDAAAGRLSSLGPRWLAPIVRRCLEVDPANRHPSMDAVADALERGLLRRRRALGAASVAIVAAAVSAIVVVTRPDIPPKRWSPILLAREHGGNPARQSAISRDGTTLGFASRTEVWTQRRKGRSTRKLPLPQGTDEIGSIALSDHGERAFVDVSRSGRDEIWEIDLATEALRQRWPSAESAQPTAYSVTDVAPDGATLLVRTPDIKSLWRLDAAGILSPAGDPVEPGNKIFDARWSPDGRHVARAVYSPKSGGDRVDILDATSGRLVEAFSKPCVTVDWLDSEALACAVKERATGVVYELRLGSGSEGRVHFVGQPFERVWKLRVTEAGVLMDGGRSEQHLYTLDTGSSVLRAVQVGALTETAASWTRDGTLVLAGHMGGRYAFVAVRPGGGVDSLQEGPVAEVPVRTLGDVIVYGQFPGKDQGYPSNFDYAKSEVALFRRTLTSGPVALGTSRGFVSVLCAGDRAPPCYLAELEGSNVRLVAWSWEDGRRGGEVLSWPVGGYYASGPALSPDGNVVAIPRADRIELVPVHGGAPTTLSCPPCELPQFLTWDPDGNIVATDGGVHDVARLVRIRMDGTAEVLVEREHVWFSYPSVSPDGKTIAVLVSDNSTSYWWVPAK